LKDLSERFWARALMGSSCLLLAVLTLTWPTWIETLTSVDPDRHSGLVEWVFVGVLVLAGVAFTGSAEFERRRWADADSNSVRVHLP
jgi:hypothetical protein